MAANEDYAPTKELVNVVVQSSPLSPEDKADDQRITAAELAAVRCIVETCASDLDVVLEQD